MSRTAMRRQVPYPVYFVFSQKGAKEAHFSSSAGSGPGRSAGGGSFLIQPIRFSRLDMTGRAAARRTSRAGSAIPAETRSLEA
jgi:hypothetical protein